LLSCDVTISSDLMQMQGEIILSMLPSDIQMIDTANGDSSIYLW
jgi:hypothetical protein